MPARAKCAAAVPPAPIKSEFLGNGGARVVVRPGLVPDVARVSNRRLAAYFRGCGSVTGVG